MASLPVPAIPMMVSTINVDVLSRRAWNDRVPMHRLPAEIFILIFLYAQSAVFPGRKGHMASVLSGVSHYWRVVALSSQDLWGTIDFTNVDRVHEYLARSGVSILSVYLKTTSEKLNPIVPLLLPKLPRVEVLQLEFTGANSREFVEVEMDKNWAQSTPHLTNVSLSYFWIPENHFVTTAPGLRSLKLEHCNIDLTGLRGLNLVKLSLMNLEHGTACEEILAELQNLPELEELDLQDVMYGGITPLSQRIHLPRLRNLNLGGVPCHTLLCFLNSISFPKDTNIATYGENTTAMPLVITAFQNCMGGDQWKLVKAIVRCDELNVSFEMLRIGHDEDFKSTNITCSWERSENVPGPYEVERILTSFDISLLLHLELSSNNDTPLPIDIWDGLFTSALGLKKLMLYGGYADSFIQAFAPSNNPLMGIILQNLTGNPQGLLQSLKFPILKTLKLQRVNDGWTEAAGPWPGDPAVFATLMQTRKILGMNLSTMITVGYDLPVPFMQSMDQCVDSFRSYREWRMGIDE
ncbi:hypothetical protein BDN72DRAFT_874399 [Pluteus cervinus]|uniref:Uncharacterized protein n=1 Tax=Pluteus cervinus TaxID=181527 RepID=A0ACD3BCE0_9AGAR|nr:hypothetical protein BDN72DRAFT_874399 [Pluteus cervinus]